MRVSINFWVQGSSVLKIRTQICNSSERLNYMQTWKLSETTLYQIQIVLADLQARTYNFMIKRIPRGFNVFTRKEKMLCFSSYAIYWVLTFHRPSNSKNNESKNILFLSNSAKDGGEHLTIQLCWVTAGFIVTCFSPINPVNGLLIVRFRLCERYGGLLS